MNALLLSLLLLVQGGAPSGTGTITGRLLSATGSPAANVRVALSPAAEGGELVGITQTDRDGRYRIERVPPGSYYVIAGLVSAPTYLPGVSSRVGASTVAVTARSITEAPDFRIAAASGGLSVKGRAILEGFSHSEPPPPVSIRLSANPGLVGMRGQVNPGPRLMVSADLAADGSFEIPNVPAGEYSVGFFPDVPPYSLPEMNVATPVVMIPGLALPLLTVDRDIANLQYTIPFARWVIGFEGTVKVDGAGSIPMAGVTLTHTDRAQASLDRAGTFSGDSFFIPVIFTGMYSFKITDLPQGYTVKSARAGSIDLLTQPLEVTPARRPKLEITLGVTSPLPGVRVTGRITNQDLSEVPGWISVNGGTPALRLSARVRPGGSFEFPSVMPGTYQVEFGNLADGLPRSFTVGTENPTRVEVPLRLTGFRKISVTVAGNLENSDWPVLMPVGRPDAANTRALRAIGVGAFEFPNVPPGNYEVVLTRGGGLRGSRGFTPRANPVPVVVADQDLRVEVTAR